MKPANLVLITAALLVVAGWILILLSKGRLATEIGVWSWVAAFVVISLPLLLSLAYRLVRRKKRS